MTDETRSDALRLTAEGRAELMQLGAVGVPDVEAELVRAVVEKSPPWRYGLSEEEDEAFVKGLEVGVREGYSAAFARLPVPVEGIEPGQVWAHHGNERWTVRALEGGKVLIDPHGEGVAMRVWPDYFRENFTRVECPVPVEGEADR